MTPFEAFSVLNLPESSSLSSIKRAYRRLALLHHPDKRRGGNHHDDDNEEEEEEEEEGGGGGGGGWRGGEGGGDCSDVAGSASVDFADIAEAYAVLTGKSENLLECSSSTATTAAETTSLKSSKVRLSSGGQIGVVRDMAVLRGGMAVAVAGDSGSKIFRFHYDGGGAGAIRFERALRNSPCMAVSSSPARGGSSELLGVGYSDGVVDVYNVVGCASSPSSSDGAGFDAVMTRRYDGATSSPVTSLSIVSLELMAWSTTGSEIAIVSSSRRVEVVDLSSTVDSVDAVRFNVVGDEKALEGSDACLYVAAVGEGGESCGIWTLDEERGDGDASDGRKDKSEGSCKTFKDDVDNDNIDDNSSSSSSSDWFNSSASSDSSVDSTSFPPVSALVVKSSLTLPSGRFSLVTSCSRPVYTLNVTDGVITYGEGCSFRAVPAARARAGEGEEAVASLGCDHVVYCHFVGCGKYIVAGSKGKVSAFSSRNLTPVYASLPRREHDGGGCFLNSEDVMAVVEGGREGEFVVKGGYQGMEVMSFYSRVEEGG